MINTLEKKRKACSTSIVKALEAIFPIRIESSHLISIANQVTCFYTKFNTALKWFNLKTDKYKIRNFKQKISSSSYILSKKPSSRFSRLYECQKFNINPATIVSVQEFLMKSLVDTFAPSRKGLTPYLTAFRTILL